MVVRPEGLEPPTVCLEGSALNPAELRAQNAERGSLPEKLESPRLDVGEPRAPARSVVGGPRVLLAVRANLVRAFTAAHLSRPLRGKSLPAPALLHGLNATFQLGPGLATIFVLVPAVDLHGDAAGQVREHDAAVGLVLVLSARASVASEAHLHVTFEQPAHGGLLRGIQHCHGDGRAVGSFATLARRLSLPAVAASLSAQGLERLDGAPQLEEQSAELGLLVHGEAVTLGVGFVERGLNQDQRLRIVAALGGANLQMQLHRRLQVVVGGEKSAFARASRQCPQSREDMFCRHPRAATCRPVRTE